MGAAASKTLSQQDALADIPSVVFKDTLGGGRFFKSSLCVHDDGGLVVVKTFIKRESHDVNPYIEALNRASRGLADIPQETSHVWADQRAVLSDRAVHLLRQYLYATVAERTARRPFLTRAEKCWLAYQILVGVAQCHERGVCHGDIKLENVLVTSWGWAFISDFAPFKPTLLPADNPTEFSTFFDTSGKRKCCIAPERFYDPTTTPQTNSTLTPAMDVFSAGCAIAELFADGTPLFDYSKLLEYRKGTYNPSLVISSLDPEIAAIVASMIQRDPADRLSAAEYAVQWTQTVLSQRVVDVIRPLFGGLLSLNNEARAVRMAEQYGLAREALMNDEPSTISTIETGHQQHASSSGGDNWQEEENEAENRNLAGKSPLGAREQAMEELHKSQGVLKELAAGRLPSGIHMSVQKEQEVKAPNAAERQPSDTKNTSGSSGINSSNSNNSALSIESKTGLVLLASALCSALQGCKKRSTRIRLLRLLCECAAECDDEVRLQRALPHLIAAAGDQSSAVRCAALRLLPRLLDAVRVLPPGESRVAGEYILPSLSLLPLEGDPAVQAEYAAALPALAVRGRELLEILYRRPQGPSTTPPPPGSATNLDAEAMRLREGVTSGLHSVLGGGRPEAALGLLPSLGPLSGALGRKETLESMLPALLTLFNAREGSVRAALYANLPAVAPALGPHGVGIFVMNPLLERLKSEPDSAAVASALHAAERLSASGLVVKKDMLKTVQRVVDNRLLQSSCGAVRGAAAQLIATIATQLDPVDRRALLLPLVAPYLNNASPEQHAFILENVESIVRALPPVSIPGAPAAPNTSSSAFLTLSPSGGSSSNNTTAQRGGSSLATEYGLGASFMQASDLVHLPTASYSVMVDTHHAKQGESMLSLALAQSIILGSNTTTTTTAPGAALAARAKRNVQVPVDISDPTMKSQLLLPGMMGMMGGTTTTSTTARGGGSNNTRVHDAAVSTGVPNVERGDQAALVSSWRPKGVLVASLHEHKRSVTCLAAAPSSPFFLSSSADGTVKIWDTSRLERDVAFRSRLTYQGHQSNEVRCVSAFADGQTIASGDLKGELHVWRVERQPGGGAHTSNGGASTANQHQFTTERYTGLSGIERLDLHSGAILWCSPWDENLVIASTQNSGLIAWDLRCSDEAWRLPFDPSEGLLDRFVTAPDGQTWLVTGSSRGVFSLWDLRFSIRANVWKHPLGSPVSALALATASASRLGLDTQAASPMTMMPKGPLVYAASTAGREIALWDVADGSCKTVYRSFKTSPVASTTMNAANTATSAVQTDAGSLMYNNNNSAATRPLSASSTPAALSAPIGGTRPLANISSGAPHTVTRCDTVGRTKALALAEVQAPKLERDGFLSLLPTAGGQLITGSTDCAVRCWEPSHADNSYVMAVPPPPLASPNMMQQAAADGSGGGSETWRLPPVDIPRYGYTLRSIQGIPVVEERSSIERYTLPSVPNPEGRQVQEHIDRMRWVERATGIAHKQAVTALLRVEGQHDGVLVTASADGVVKAWK